MIGPVTLLARRLHVYNSYRQANPLTDRKTIMTNIYTLMAPSTLVAVIRDLNDSCVTNDNDGVTLVAELNCAMVALRELVGCAMAHNLINGHTSA